jgi:3-deoxy-7-phosphoheptulonate synthase
MIVVMKVGSPEAEVTRLCQEFTEWGLQPEKIVGRHKVIVGLVGDTASLDERQIEEKSPWIESVLRVERPYKRASREFRHGQPSEIAVSTPEGNVLFGQHHPIVVVAGPCSVENEEMIVETALRVKKAGAKFLRGGAYKPRTSPYAFQGHGESALGLLQRRGRLLAWVLLPRSWILPMWKKLPMLPMFYRLGREICRILPF